MESLQMISNRYQITDQIGDGGMGEVYRATDTQTGHTVAIKRLKPDVIEHTPDVIERFAREGELLQQLNHPNIVKVLDTVRENGQHFIVMEYMPKSLSQLLKQQPRLPVERVLSIALALVDALTRTHQLKIIHRDIKPDNMLLAEDGTALLTDFGIARADNSLLTDTDLLLGTYAYLSPESFNSAEPDTRTDIWSFGVMLFEMLAGRRPFEGRTAMELLNSILYQPLPDLEALRSDAPVALIDLIYQMLDKQRDQRIASVRLIGAELDRIIRNGDTPLQAMRPTITPLPGIAPRSSGLRNNLPAQTTPFVGREEELAELARLLQHHRLVTVLAPGGMGKTRLALAYAEQQLDQTQDELPFQQGVFFVPLAPLISADTITPAVVEAVGMKVGTGDLKPQLLDYLADKQFLLILDNFEHLLAGVSLVSDIMKAAPQIKIIATSRERLNLGGETVYNLDGMNFPAWEVPEDALEYSAVKLFLQGAQRVQASFQIRAEDLSYITRICRMVQGMPLGILLAAGWVELLSLAEITAEIEQSFDFLETEQRDMPERQRSIRAVFEYSWRLLTDQERETFVKLSVFRGGCTRQAVQEITGTTLQILARLVNKSLLRRNAETGRYEIHELLRQYAAEQLKASAESDVVQETHSTYYLTALADRMTDIKGRRQIMALDDIEIDFENVRAAWQWAVHHKRHVLLQLAAESLHTFSQLRNRFVDHFNLFSAARASLAYTESLIAGGDKSADVEAAYRTWGWLLIFHNRFESTMTDELVKAQAIARKYKDNFALAFANKELSRALSVHGMEHVHRMLPLLEDSLAYFQQQGDKFYEVEILSRIAFSSALLGDVPRFMELTRQYYQIAKEIGDDNRAALALLNLGSGEFQAGNYEASIGHFVEGGALYRKVGDRAYMANNNGELAFAYVCVGEFEKAQALIDEILEICATMNEPTAEGLALTVQSMLLMLRNGNTDRTYSLAQRGRPLLTANASITYLGEIALALSAWVTGNLAESLEHLRFLLGYSNLYRNVPLKWLTFLIFTIILTDRQQSRRAAELLSMLDHHPVRMSGWFDHWDRVAQMKEQLQAALGEDVFNAAQETGKALDLNTVAIQLEESQELARL